MLRAIGIQVEEAHEDPCGSDPSDCPADLVVRVAFVQVWGLVVVDDACDDACGICGVEDNLGGKGESGLCDTEHDSWISTKSAKLSPRPSAGHSPTGPNTPHAKLMRPICAYKSVAFSGCEKYDGIVNKLSISDIFIVAVEPCP